MSTLLNKIGALGLGVTLVAAAVGAGTARPVLASDNSSSTDPSTYMASLRPLNGSGVTGFANLSLNSQQPGASLMASVNARGAEPNQIHPLHIHGMTDGTAAECPPIAADVNHDGLISVFEGAPFYGPIKVSFTSPATPFGAPAITTLFAPFAGAPVLANFPHSSNAGRISYNNTIPFDTSNHFAVEALSSLMPLTDQHIVLHGGFAPESVDTTGGDPNKIVYDALLPIACGSIVQTHQGSITDNNQNDVNGTGPYSRNEVNIRTDNRVNTTNTNNVTFSSSSENTEVDSVMSGNASNDASTSTVISLVNSSLGIN